MNPQTCDEKGNICSYSVFNALSFATDLFERTKTGHAKRVAYTSLKLAGHMGMSIADMNRLFNAAILHDVGIGFGINDAYQEDREYTKADHVKKGASIVEEFFHDQVITDAVLYHHENFDGSGYLGVRGTDIPLFAGLINLANYLDTIYERRTTYSEARKENQAAIAKQSGILFDPLHVAAFIEMTVAERFWLDYRHENFDSMLERIISYNQIIIELDDLIKVAHVFAKMIDDKSKFTKEHSNNVAFYMRETAKMKHYDEETQKKVYIAGLFHDVGKVSVPSSILDKPGPLSLEERNHIKVHSYYTRLILDNIPNIDDIARWASNHHELIDGTGYPERLKEDELDYFSRLITVCDIYEALSENRPYRKAMSYEEAWQTLHEMRDEHVLCPEACRDLKAVTDLMILEENEKELKSAINFDRQEFEI